MSLKGKTAEETLRIRSPQDIGESAEAEPLSPGEGFPAVLASSPCVASGSSMAHMIDLMESAASQAMHRYLRAGESSVAIEFQLEHMAYSARPVRAVAIHRGTAGRLHHFTLQAFDESGLIGTAEHTRAVVVGKRFLALARKRAGRPSMLLGA